MKVRYKLNGKEVSREEVLATADPAAVREMLAAGSPPMSNTDREFLEGRNDNQQQATLGMFAEQFKAQAVAAGVSPKGKVYQSGLAQFPGDPQAWVSDRADVARRCAELNYGCEGAVSAKTDNSRLEDS